MNELYTYYKRYLGYVRPYKWLYLISMFLAVSLLFLYNYVVFLIGDVVDEIAAGEEQLYRSVLMIAFFLALPLVIEPVAFHARSRVFSLTVRDITSQVYRNILNLDYSYHVNKQTGKLITMIINAPQIPRMFIWHFEWFSIEKLAELIIPLMLIFVISWQVGLSVTLVLVISIPIIVWSFRLNIKKRNALKEADYDRNSTIVDGLSNYETVHAFGREIEEQEILDQNLDDCRLTMNSYQNTFRLIDFVTRAVGVALFLAGGLVLVTQYNEGSVSVGELVVVLAYLISMSSITMGFVFSIREVLKELPIVEDFYELLDSRSTIVEKEDAQELIDPKGVLKFKDVSFEFNKGDKVIDHLSLEIQPKQNIALVGPSGGGKTTITRLLMRYYDVDDGEVAIDGVNVVDLKRSFLREFIGLVPQEPVLFNRTIFYNVAYALDVSEEKMEKHRKEVVDACKKAQIHDFIESLPKGYDTFVGERGLKLSGGQKQRLAIARVLIKNPQVVIFDEATSMLDSESEIAIQKAFKELSKDKTTLIIAHRLSTITHCDKVYVIDEGKVVEDGTHDELVSNKGLYSKLWDIQSGGFEKGY